MEIKFVAPKRQFGGKGALKVERLFINGLWDADFSHTLNPSRSHRRFYGAGVV